MKNITHFITTTLLTSVFFTLGMAGLFALETGISGTANSGAMNSGNALAMFPTGFEATIPLDSTPCNSNSYDIWSGSQDSFAVASPETGMESYMETKMESEPIIRGARRSSLSRQVLNKSGLSSMTQVFANAYLGGGKIKPKDTYRGDRDLFGAQVGMNFDMLGGTVAGFYNYNKGSLDVLDSSIDQTSHLGGISYSNNASCIYWSLVGAGGIDNYDLTMGGTTNSFDGWQGLGLIEIGGEMDTGTLFVLRPFTMLQYSYLKADGLVDRIEEQRDDAFWSTMGSRVDIRLGSDNFKLQGRMAWVHQLRSDNEPISNYWFGRVPGTVTPTQCHFSGSTGRDYFWGGFGLKMAFFSRMAITLDYDILLNSYQNVQLGSAGLLLAF